MKNSQLTALADRIGASSSAVSKAINHCPGLGAELRERILDIAATEGVSGRRTACDVYVILPDTPTYFWRAFLKALGEALEGRGLTAKYNVYTAFGDRAVVERYLDEAEALSPSVLLIAAQDAGVEERLSAMSTRRAVISLIDPIPAPNVFFVGSDHRADGRMLCERVRREHPTARRVLLLSPSHTEERLAGFVEAAAGLDCRTVRLSGGESAAELARMLDATRRAWPSDAVVCMNGSTQLLGMALKKCRLDLPCYGFETPPIDPRYPLPDGEVAQELERIAEAAASIAADFVHDGVYPSSKCTYVASRYVQRHREA